MSQISVSLLGIAAVKISNSDTTIYIDSIINFAKHPLKSHDYSDANIIIITHDHDDHYNADEVARAAKQTNAFIVGPPSIAYSLLVDYHIEPSQLKILYHQDPGTPVEVRIGTIVIRSYASLHFHDGDNMTIHNSYLIEMDGRKIYLTGDSYSITNKDKRLFDLDLLIPNIVFFDMQKEHVSIIEDFSRTFHPKKILPAHLIDCNWTIPIEDVKDEIEKRQLESVIVLDTEQSTVCL
jgi:L-ascorbate metabolism protein UlaG (beta-lactamase superfamily)